MIERGLMADLGGAARLDFDPLGVTWSIEVLITPEAFGTEMTV